MSGAWGEGWGSGFGGEPPEGVPPLPGMDRLGIAIRQLIQVTMGMPDKSVRPADQSAPADRTMQEFATVKLREAEDASWGGNSIITQEDGSIIEELSVMQYITASVNFYRGPTPQTDAVGMPIYTTGAYDRASRLPKRLQLSQFSEMMRSMGLGYIGHSPARNLAGISDGHWESRGQIDITFSAIAIETGTIDVYETAQLAMIVESPDGAHHEIDVPDVDSLVDVGTDGSSWGGSWGEAFGGG